MPDARVHRRIASRREQVALSLLAGEFREWAVTALFYPALHLADSYLAGSGMHPATHQERNRLVYTLAALKPVSSFYLALHDHSLQARYQGRCLSTVYSLIDTRFRPLKEQIDRLS